MSRSGRIGPGRIGGHAAARVLLWALVLLLMLPAAGPARSAPRPDLSRIKTLAIAPFADEASLSRPVAEYGAARLSELAARGPFRIVPASRVAREMQRLGITASALTSPTQTVAVGQEVGADAVLTGRVTLFLIEHEPRVLGDDPDGSRSMRVDVDIRVLEVASRLNLFWDSFICRVDAISMPSMAAMECVVRDVILRLGLGRI